MGNVMIYVLMDIMLIIILKLVKNVWNTVCNVLTKLCVRSVLIIIILLVYSVLIKHLYCMAHSLTCLALPAILLKLHLRSIWELVLAH